jgi:hypothetical protein
MVTSISAELGALYRRFEKFVQFCRASGARRAGGFAWRYAKIAIFAVNLLRTGGQPPVTRVVESLDAQSVSSVFFSSPTWI